MRISFYYNPPWYQGNCQIYYSHLLTAKQNRLNTKNAKKYGSRHLSVAKKNEKREKRVRALWTDRFKLASVSISSPSFLKHFLHLLFFAHTWKRWLTGPILKRLRSIPVSYIHVLIASSAWFSYSEVFEKMIFVFLGINIWEIFSTCSFEWSLLCGRRRFRWPLVWALDYRPDNLTHHLIGYEVLIVIRSSIDWDDLPQLSTSCLATVSCSRLLDCAFTCFCAYWLKAELVIFRIISISIKTKASTWYFSLHIHLFCFAS